MLFTNRNVGCTKIINFKPKLIPLLVHVWFDLNICQKIKLSPLKMKWKFSVFKHRPTMVNGNWRRWAIATESFLRRLRNSISTTINAIWYRTRVLTVAAKRARPSTRSLHWFRPFTTNHSFRRKSAVSPESHPLSMGSLPENITDEWKWYVLAETNT